MFIFLDKFLAFKTPLDSRYNEKVSSSKLWTCRMLIDSVKSLHRTLGLIIDLTNTDRFYNSETEFKQKNIQYEKIRCRGHDERPSPEQITEFIDKCNKFWETHPSDIIGVHCTHGFNRTGFLICSYLCRELGYSIDAAIDSFAKARIPGIYKQDYLDELLQTYGDESFKKIPAPARPEWCSTYSDDEDEPKEKRINGQTKRVQRVEPTAKRFKDDGKVMTNPQFAIPLPGVVPVCQQPCLGNIQRKCHQMCDYHRQGFPGSQPVSMDITNYETIVQSPYMVSWKADGTRYMMLIEEQDKIYMFDRDNNAFHIPHLHFPKDSDLNSHITDTLVDGELVSDKVNGTIVPRYLIYDIVTYENQNVAKLPFKERLDIIHKSIIKPREEAAQKHIIDKQQESFSIREKGFWPLTALPKLTSDKFIQQILHEVDGLIFQPMQDPYIPGRSVRVLKWKEHNTVDFRLKISIDKSKTGQLPEKSAYLYVNGLPAPFAQMKYSSSLKEYDNKIVECIFRDGQWHFLKERLDKSFPNAIETACGAIRAIQDPITKERLISLAQNVQAQQQHTSGQY
ncbi:unnamed protein product [Didymodactylos carnosus]|uniref:mRNA-capping enzyme n=1 Tax=Didymodactylos carnosus TaxID=1234261 RepID=A0A814XFN6_9BILA|nr:unnamed protein product [Didymodactylos carnosus]CAF3979503.1 unnamed protein product [Didymodactylos carnosus]